MFEPLDLDIVNLVVMHCEHCRQFSISKYYGKSNRDKVERIERVCCKCYHTGFGLDIPDGCAEAIIVDEEVEL